MHHLPKPQDQARILKDALKALNLGVKHQDALEVVAKMMGFRNWKTLSATSLEAETSSPPGATPKAEEPVVLKGPADGDIYEAFVTIGEAGVTMSARIQVRAYSLEDARELLPVAGFAQFPKGFEIDEGNWPRSSEFYLGDPNDVENISNPGSGDTIEVEFDHHGEDWGSAKWSEGGFDYLIMMNRLEPDNGGDEDAWAQCEITITVSRDGVKCEEVIKDYECHRDNLAEWLEECWDHGDFNEEILRLTEELKKKLKLK